MWLEFVTCYILTACKWKTFNSFNLSVGVYLCNAQENSIWLVKGEWVLKMALEGVFVTFFKNKFEIMWSFHTFHTLIHL